MGKQSKAIEPERYIIIWHLSNKIGQIFFFGCDQILWQATSYQICTATKICHTLLFALSFASKNSFLGKKFKLALA